MAYPIKDKLVVGITSSALFDFSHEHEIFGQNGVETYCDPKAACPLTAHLQPFCFAPNVSHYKRRLASP